MRIIEKNIVGASIFSSDNKLLLGKSLRGTYEGCWLIPGGGVEEGETLREALRRELLEEIDLDIKTFDIEELDLRLTGESPKILKETNEKVLGRYTFYNFVIRHPKPAAGIHVKSMDDFSDAKWHDVSKLNKLKLPPPSIATLKYLGLL